MTGHRAADEARHEPGTEPWWAESWHFDFVGGVEGALLGGFVQLALYPAQGAAWFWAYLVGDELGLVAVRDDDVPIPGGRALEIRSAGLWAELACETPFEHWGIGLEAFGVRLDDPRDALGDERGIRLPVGLDLEWEASAPAADLIVSADGAAGHYEHPGSWHGELAVGDLRLPLVGRGQRDHSWGPRSWWAAPWHWAAYGFDDGARAVTVLDAAEGAFTTGWRWRDHAEPTPIRTVDVETHLDRDGLPTAARHVLHDDRDGGVTEVDIEVLHLAPVPVRAPDGRVARYVRALCRFTDSTDGASGAGWAEWLRPPEGTAAGGTEVAR